MEKRLHPPERMNAFKGESVIDPRVRRLTAKEDILKENPYKTPPNNHTTNEGYRGSKG